MNQGKELQVASCTLQVMRFPIGMKNAESYEKSSV